MLSALRRTSTLAVAALLVAGPVAAAYAAPGGGPGKPPGAGQGGGNRPDNPGQATGSGKGSGYADLMVIARDSEGLPILDVNGCVQPITADPAIGVPVFSATDLYPYDSDVYAIPLAGTSPVALAEEEDELEPCDPLAEYASYVSEVDLGRLNLGRSPERVLAKQLSDVVAALSGATVTLDASGRLVADEVAIDSPLQNLTIYQSILETGQIGPLAVPAVDLGDWQLTATALAAGAPKEGFEITVDTVQYLNRILNIPSDTDWAGTLPPVNGEEFLDFRGLGSYDRAGTFPGCVRWNQEIFPGKAPTSIMSEVFSDIANSATGNIDAYVQLAEDAHKVLVWVHDQGILIHSVDPITVDSNLC